MDRSHVAVGFEKGGEILFVGGEWEISDNDAGALDGGGWDEGFGGDGSFGWTGGFGWRLLK